MARVIAINLDGFDFDFARKLAAEGAMPELTQLAAEARQFVLDHGDARSTGLAGEHIATGRTPEEIDSFAITRFDPVTYDSWLETTSEPPFVAKLDSATVSFDMSYFRLEDAPNTQGITYWGAHDQGCKKFSKPASLADELTERFGHYKGKGFEYGFVYASESRAKQMGDCLSSAVLQRADAVEWVLGERLPDWKLALITVSEPHSGIEGLGHGIVDGHPCGALPSAASARAGMRAIYMNCDTFIGRMRRAFPDAEIVVYAMHGMGANESDTPTMALLAELMFKREFGNSLLDARASANRDPETGLLIPIDPTNWERSVRMGIGSHAGLRRHVMRLRRWQMRRRLDAHNARVEANGGAGGLAESIDWIPATLYRPFWPKMRAFALPSFTDGEIRINLAQRERHGRVAREDYSQTIDELVEFMDGVVDETGASAVRWIEVDERRDPDRRDGRQADIRVVWQRNATSLSHPSIGEVGPLPWRRTGGHTGGKGMALVTSAAPLHRAAAERAAIAADTGLLDPDRAMLHSAFDVVPTLVSLIGEDASGFTGKDLLASDTAAPVVTPA